VARGIIVVRTRPVDPAREDEFNDWYTNVHIPEILTTPGFVAARRYRTPGTSDYLAVYEIEGDDLDAVRKGMAAGRAERTTSDALQTDPPPVVTFYELLEG
jgi:hypothetical protein